MRTFGPILLLVVLVAAACGDDASGRRGDDAAAGTDLEARIRSASQGLCDARAAASGGDPDDAAAAFEDRAHDALHAIASRVQERDRAAAARLLEDKQRVEDVIRADATADPAQLQALLGQLHRAVGEAAGALGLSAPPCEEAA